MERPPPSGETSTDTRSIRQRRKGWDSLVNGDLIDRAEQEGYEAPSTTDQSMQYQQNLTGGRIAIVVLLSTAWPRVQHPTEETRRSHRGSRAGTIQGSPDLNPGDG